AISSLTLLIFHCILGRFICARCEKHYKRKGHLQRHIKYECGDTGKFKCLLCAYTCKRAERLRKHLLTKKHSLA
ncbi:hypothetical protein ILUMI_21536, partial [Ignelater luminosus]